ncbi:aldehyde dehydrogenase family protein [Dongia sp.]|uniref:aldehyde dehydrogenase family protein n=1 Tax=Dongia sp. TaxID=1977262 RepID=UPI0037529BB0
MNNSDDGRIMPLPAPQSMDFNPDEVPMPEGHWIDGALLTAGSDRIPVRRPSDGKIFAEIPDASEDVVDRAVAGAAAALRTSGWAEQPPRARARAMRRWADLIDADTERLGRLEAAGTTRPIAEMLANDVQFTAEGIRFFAEYADKLGGEVLATQADHFAMSVAEPYGVVAAIAPWNFPLSLASWKCAPALAAGNAVVLKPSELTPFSAVRLAELAIEAGIPNGILNVIQGRGATAGRSLVRHGQVGKITFTGSPATGASIMAEAASSGIKPVTLELGGKSPQLVFGDVPDVASVAHCIARGILGNGGQVCVAGSRLIVQRRIADELLARVSSLMRQVRPGATWCGATKFSPIMNNAQLTRIERIVAESRAMGAVLETGGRRMEEGPGGDFYAPTILSGVRRDMPCVKAEIFGPVLTVQTFDTDEEGIGLAQHEDYGLAAGIHTENLGLALSAMRRIPAGTVWINRYGRTHDFIIPTGGFGRSGFGKDLGRQAVEANLRHKSVLMDLGFRPAAQAV